MVQIGSRSLPGRSTVVDVTTEEVEDRTRKVVRIRTLLEGFPTADAMQQSLDTLQAQAEAVHRGDAVLSLHEGRYHNARRREFVRYDDERTRIAAVYLEWLTEDVYERSRTEHLASTTWSTSGQSIEITQAGNAPARPRISLAATAALQCPAISDGTRTLACNATVAAGDSLTLDSDACTAALGDGSSVLAHLSGDFPLLEPATTTLVCTVDGETAPDGIVQVFYRDTWY